MKKVLFITLIAACCLSLAGCLNLEYTERFDDQLAPEAPIAPVADAQTTTTITYFLPTENKVTFCDGENMDSAGFAKTITEETTKEVTGTFASTQDLVNRTMAIAATDAHLLGQILKISNDGRLTDFYGNPYIKINDGTAYVAWSEGYAGISIFLCTWKPFIEKNLTQFKEIKKVVWTASPEEWNKLK